MRPSVHRPLSALVVALLTAAACSGGSSEATSGGPETSSVEAGEQLHPDVVDASFSLRSDGNYDVSVTLSSPYETPERYADAWRVRTLEGEVLGIRELAHDHANEQPFTRSLSNVVIPDGVEVVLVDGRDQENGWGDAVEFEVPR